MSMSRSGRPSVSASWMSRTRSTSLAPRRARTSVPGATTRSAQATRTCAPSGGGEGGPRAARLRVCGRGLPPDLAHHSATCSTRQAGSGSCGEVPGAIIQNLDVLDAGQVALKMGAAVRPCVNCERAEECRPGVHHRFDGILKFDSRENAKNTKSCLGWGSHRRQIVRQKLKFVARNSQE